MNGLKEAVTTDQKFYRWAWELRQKIEFKEAAR